jgi:predicted Zn-dependent peptidase
MEFDAEPLLMMGYHKPTFPNRDDAIANIISGVLTSGRTSRLYKDLIRDKQISVSINAFSGPGSRYDNEFSIMAAPRYPHTNEELEKAISEHLEKLKTEPVGEKELQKIKNNIEANYIRSMSSNMGLGISLLRYHLFYSDWKLYMKIKEILYSITPQDIMDFAKKYFTTENRTVAYLNKKVK